MNSGLRKWIIRQLSHRGFGKKLLLGRYLVPYFEEIGWFNSIREQLPVDRNSNYIPWFTYPAIAFLQGRIQPDMEVFEYGSGTSTLWWAEKVSSVISCEHDIKWYSSIKTKIPFNAEILHYNLEVGGEYCKAILEYKNRFNIIVIDGRDRVNCAKNSPGALREDGVIIWDNVEREKYQEGFFYLIQNGFRRLDFEGLGPVGRNKWITSIFYRRDNCFGI